MIPKKNTKMIIILLNSVDQSNLKSFPKQVARITTIFCKSSITFDIVCSLRLIIKFSPPAGKVSKLMCTQGGCYGFDLTNMVLHDCTSSLQSLTNCFIVVVTLSMSNPLIGWLAGSLGAFGRTLILTSIKTTIIQDHNK